MAIICLTMIVKNEAHVIRRGLDSVKPFIHTWVIVDTGSTDGTQEIIREHMKDIPGELHERRWKNFAHNRNQAIELARNKAQYLLFADADEELVAPPGWRMPELTGNAYRIQARDVGAITYKRTSLVPTREAWRYEGVMHEVIECRQPHAPVLMLQDVYWRVNADGARSQDPQKAAKDAQVLERALKEDPYNSRHVFYLGQCYRGSAQWARALEAYKKRVTMGGFDQEVYCAYFYLAVCAEELQYDESFVIRAYLRAYEDRPIRAEPLHELARYCRLRGSWPLAYLFAKAAAAIPHPGLEESLFVYEQVYTWRALDEWAVAASWTGRWRETKELCERLLANAALPAIEHPRVQRNLDLACKNLGETNVIARAA